MTASVDDIVRTIDLTVWELAALRVAVKDTIEDEHKLFVEGRACMLTREDAERFARLTEKLK